MKLNNHHTIYNRFFISLFFVLFAATFSFAQQVKSSLLFEKTKVIEDITYKKDASGNPLQLDIYQPKTNDGSKKPVVLYLHGGAWVEGDKMIPANNYVENTILDLVENNYVVISINYRLVKPEVHFPGPAQDAKDAVRWVRKNAEKYHFDTENIGMWGVSAGAHLSLLTAYTTDKDFIGDPDLEKYSGEVNYVVSNFGPTNINKLLHTRAPKPMLLIVQMISKKLIDLRAKLVRGMTGLDIKKQRKEAVQALKIISPINYTEKTVPTLMLHGDKDKIAPIQHSKRLAKMLKKENTPHQLIVVKDGDHGFKTTDTTYQSQLNKAMVDFIKEQAK